jgi:hypothetical protein
VSGRKRLARCLKPDASAGAKYHNTLCHQCPAALSERRACQPLSALAIFNASDPLDIAEPHQSAVYGSVDLSDMIEPEFE